MQKKKELAYAIREAMALRGITQADLAQMVGRSGVTVGRWVRGETAPSILDASALAEALGVKPEYLMSPLPIPEYRIADFLVETTVESATREGLRRSARRGSSGK